MLIDQFLRLTGVDKDYLLWVAETASKRYKVYNINKRNGGKREISHPARGIKAIQRWINKVVFLKFPVHESATAYKKGASIRYNAMAHAGTCFTLRLDYKDFFPSFSSNMLVKFLKEKSAVFGIHLSDDDIDFISKVVMKDGCLTIGAPSSPSITNAMMYDFDQAVCSFCLENNLVYTRYADDIYISSRTSNILGKARDTVFEISDRLFEGNLKFNAKKTCFLSKRYRRTVTGLVITTDKSISIGRKRKREIRTLVYKYARGELSPVEIWRLRGLLAFCKDVELNFYSSLCRKYGEITISKLMSDSKVKSDKIIGSLRRSRFRISKKIT